MSKESRNPKRSQAASAIVELGFIIALIMPLALLAVNICYLCVGSFINDNACREAARAAAQQTSLDPATGAAKAVVQSFSIGGAPVTIPDNGVQFSYQNDSDGNPIDITSLDATTETSGPAVTVTTQIPITVPAPILFMGNKFTDHVLLSNTYTFPVLNGIDTNPSDTNDSGSDDLSGVTTDPADPTPADTTVP